MTHPNYDDCNCQDSWEHNQVLRSLGEQKTTKDVETMSNPVEKDAIPSNPLLDILNEIIKPKKSSSGINVTEMLEAATAMHQMFKVFVEAGFTESQALVLVGGVLIPRS